MMKINEELEQLLKNLKLRRVLDIYDEQLRAAEKEDTSYTEFVTRLMRAQWHARQEHALEWRIRNAKLPERWSLDTFPFARQPGVNRKQIRTFAELDFVSKKENIVFVGPTGVQCTAMGHISVGSLPFRFDRKIFVCASSVVMAATLLAYPCRPIRRPAMLTKLSKLWNPDHKSIAHRTAY